MHEIALRYSRRPPAGLDPAETALSIYNRNSIASGVKFLFKATLRRLDLVAGAQRPSRPIHLLDLYFSA